MTRTIRHETGLFASLSDRVVGPVVALDDLNLEGHPRERIQAAQKTWAQRAQTEFRSVQIMNRFLGEVLGAGDPIEVYACVADLIVDEIRHARLCVALCEKLGGTPVFPEPVDAREPEAYTKAPAAERALHTAIAMLCVNETLSVAFVRDLQERCTDPAVRRVLDATLADEEGHGELGWTYVEKSLGRFPESTRPAWQELVRRTLEPHRRAADPLCAAADEAGRTLGDLPEPELARLGLFSPPRQALVYRRCMSEELGPRLHRLGLLPG